LKLLNSNNVEYLLIGGYAVGTTAIFEIHERSRIWVNLGPEKRRSDRAGFARGFALVR
jgi:hypothetical protein